MSHHLYDYMIYIIHVMMSVMRLMTLLQADRDDQSKTINDNILMINEMENKSFVNYYLI